MNKLPPLKVRLPRFSLPSLPSWHLSVGELVSPSAVALAVAGDGLRITAMKGAELTFWQHVPLPLGLLRRGWIADPDAFGIALRNVLDTNALPGGRLLWALPGTVAVARLLSIRLAGVPDPDSLVAHEASWAMAVAPEDYYLYWRPVPNGFADHVYVLAVQKEAIDGLLRACAVAKVRPQLVDLKPLTLVFALGKTDAVIADVEPTGSEVLVVVQGLPLAMRSSYLGDAYVDPAYVREKVVDDLCLAIQLYNETNPDVPLDPATPVYLTGDLANAELAARVSFATKHPTVEPETPFACPPGFPVGRFMVNLGLLLKRP